MKTLITIVAIFFAISASAQPDCHLLIEQDDITVCTGQQITVTANGPGVGLGNGGECGYLHHSMHPLAWYPFCGNLLDGRGLNHASPGGVPVVFGADRFGRDETALASGYLVVPDNSAMNFYSGPFTISAWVNVVSSQDNQYIIRKGSDSTDSDFALFLKYDSIADITYPGFYTKGAHEVPHSPYDTVFWQTFANSVNIADSAWHMVTVVRNDAFISLYVDGNLISTEQFAGAYGVILVNNHFAVIGGKELSTDNTLSGSLDDLSIFYGAFSSLEIADLYSITAIDYNWSTGESADEVTIIPVSDTTLIVTADNGTDICTDTFNIYVSGVAAISADTIYGDARDCIQRRGGVKYFSTDSLPGALAYHWITPPGLDIESGQGTSEIKTRWKTSNAYYGITGELCLAVESTCGIGDTICIPVDMQITTPGTPPYIFSNHIYKMCPGDTSSFYIAPVTRASFYEWTMPPGLHIVGEGDGSSVTVAADSLFAGGDIAVRAKNVCGASAFRSKHIDFNLPIRPAVSGPADDLCHRELGNGNLYYAVANKNLYSSHTDFHWTVPSWMEIEDPLGVPSPNVLVSYLHTTNVLIGHITVTAVNSCGTSTTGKRAVRNTPFYIEPVTGPLNPCSGDTVMYTFYDPSWHAMQEPVYEWGWELGIYNIHNYIVSGDSTNTIQMYWPSMLPPNVVLKVREISEECGKSPWRKLEQITVRNCQRLISDVPNALIYPNPATEKINVQYNSVSNGYAYISVLDVTGRAVIEMRVKLSAGFNDFDVDCNYLSEGNYILRIIENDGTAGYHHFLRQ